MGISLGPILAITVAVADLDLATRANRSLLSHEELAAGAGADGRWVVLGPAGAGWGLVQLVERAGWARSATFRNLGWTALEILVADADAIYERCLAVERFQVLQRPGGVERWCAFGH